MKLLGLIGYPLTHSFSEAYFKKKFHEEGINGWDYRLFPLQSIEEFPRLLRDNPSLHGLNVTIPYKVSVMEYLDELDPVAAEIGAVNTIRIEEGRRAMSLQGTKRSPQLKGFNTDVYGFEESLKPLLEPHHTSALILGTGGVSKAVAYVLKKLGIPHTYVSRKTGELNYGQLTEEFVTQNKLIINTTPLGMHPGIETCPSIPYEFIGSGHLLYDLVYNPAETLFLKKGKTRGATIKNGEEMLILQAEKAWEIWNK